MKRRAANVKVTKRAAPQSSNASSNGAGNSATGGGGEENGSNQDKEFMGVVSLVQIERHYGFIEVCQEVKAQSMLPSCCCFFFSFLIFLCFVACLSRRAVYDHFQLDRRT